MQCDFKSCGVSAKYVSSRQTSSATDFPKDVQDLVDDGTITGEGLLAEYWCESHRPSNAVSFWAAWAIPKERS